MASNKKQVFFFFIIIAYGTEKSFLFFFFSRELVLGSASNGSSPGLHFQATLLVFWPMLFF